MSIQTDEWGRVLNRVYLAKCQQVSELRWQVRRWQFLAWLLGITSAALLVILIWG